jgi:DNA helicase-2/ATP-dependent DNA helicase PcrA
MGNMFKEILTHGLNPQQKEAILYTKGPLFILAGAGSGKTKVIAHKFSYLVKTKGLHTDSVFTVTFTNKAAEEMKARICSLLEKDMNSCWIGTLHSHCNRILRKDIKVLGHSNSFSIYDEDDQCNLVRHILKEFKIHEALYKGIVSRISSLKSSLIGPDEFLSSGDGFGFDEKLAKVYIRYEDELRKCNALDYDDLIMLTVKLFEKNPKVLEKYQGMFSYFLIDDFQDTTRAQYCLLKLLISTHKQACVVCDDDQFIYRMRSADIHNIGSFENDFPGMKLIKLEQSYRFTQNILNVAGAAIAQNLERKSKNLWTKRDGGEKVYHCWFYTYEEEAKYIAKIIKELYLKGRYEYKDFAIFYRVNLQARVLEDALCHEGLPYRVLGNVSFYHRKEIKDVVAYMRLSLNQGDNVSLRRIINCPSRGLSSVVLSKIEQEAKRKSISLFDAIKATSRTDSIAPAVRDKLSEFVKLIGHFSSLKYRSASEMLRNLLDKSGYTKTLDEGRVRNVEELIASAEGKEVKDFLDHVSLCTSIDEIAGGDYISLMTLHNAKGVESPVVFIAGLEEGVLPYCKAIEGKDEITEERRLFYVGMTRAKDILWLTGASKRRLYAKVQDQEPSRFLKDILKNCCQWMETITTYSVTKQETVKKKVVPKHAFALYSAGCRVKHPTWGVGVVRDCYGDGDEQKIMVNFPTIGLKRIAIKFVNLEKI